MAGRGFSLVEMLVVIFIIMMLAGLTAGIYAYMRAQAHVQAVTTSMGFLLNANLRYQQTVPLALKNTDAAGYFVDLASNGTKDRAMTPMEYFILRTSNNPDCQQQLDRIPSNLFVTEQAKPIQVWDSGGKLFKTGYILKTVVDPWGTEFKYRSLSNATLVNPDNSVGEQDPAMPYSDYAYFASAGPNGQWGTLAAHDANQPDQKSRDNIYSFTANQ